MKKIKVLSLGSVSPECGGKTMGGVAMMHSSLIEVFYNYNLDIEIVGVLPFNSIEKKDPITGIEYLFKLENEKPWETLNRIIDLKNPDCIIMHHIAHNWGAALSKVNFSKPIIGYIHSWRALNQDKNNLKLALVKQALPKISLLLFNSQDCLHETQKFNLSISCPLRIIHPCLSKDFLTNSINNNNNKNIVFVGNLLEHKGAIEFVQSFKYLNDYSGIIIGDGKEKKKIENIISSLGLNKKVKLLGPKKPKEIVEYIKNSSILCAPSQYEPFGIVYIEALSLGVPIIGYAPSVREIEETIGVKCGYPLKEGTAQEIADAVKWVSKQKWDNALISKKTIENFSPLNIATNFSKEIKKVVNDNPKKINNDIHKLSKKANNRLDYLNSLFLDSAIKKCLTIPILDKVKLSFSNQKTINKDKLRSLIIKQNPLPYYFNESTISSYPGVLDRANNNLKDGVRLNGKIFLYSIPFKWEENKSFSRNIRYKIQSWVMYDSLLKADVKLLSSSANNDTIDPYQYIIPVIKLISEWNNTFIFNNNHKNEFLWYDMAVGQRATKLAYVMNRVARDDYLFSKYYSFLSKCLITAEVHMLELMQEEKIAMHSNHGLFQMGGLLALAASFPILKSSKQAIALASNKILTMINNHFTSDGLHKEHSPEYHIYMANFLSTLVQSNYINNSDIINLSNLVIKNSKWLCDPSGYFLCFGDTHNIEIIKKANFLFSENNEEINFPKGLKVFKEGGLAIYRNKTSYLAFNTQFHSRQHKHADDLNFYLYDKGIPIIVDSGTYKYEYEDPHRIYIESTRAHNVVEIDNLNHSRLLADAYGSCLGGAKKFNDLIYFSGKIHHKRFLPVDKSVFKQKNKDAIKVNIKHERKIFYIPSKCLIVYDNLYSDKSYKFTQWFHFNQNMNLEKDGNKIKCFINEKSIANIFSYQFGDKPLRTKIIKGKKSHPIQGWVANSEGNDLTPNYALGNRLETVKGAFVTIFDLAVRRNTIFDLFTGSKPKIKIKNNGKYIRYNDGNINLKVKNDYIILNNKKYDIK